MDRRLHRFRHFCRAYIDNVIIFSRTAQDYVLYVTTILELFQDINLGISPKSSVFDFPSVGLLGFRVGHPAPYRNELRDATDGHAASIKLQHNLDVAYTEATGRSPLEVVYSSKPKTVADLVFQPRDRQVPM